MSVLENLAPESVVVVSTYVVYRFLDPSDTRRQMQCHRVSGVETICVYSSFVSVALWPFHIRDLDTHARTTKSPLPEHPCRYFTQRIHDQGTMPERRLYHIIPGAFRTSQFRSFVLNAQQSAHASRAAL